MQIRQDPPTLLRNVRLDNLTEASRGIPADLLDGALVERRDGLLVRPVARRGIPEDLLAAMLVGKLDEQFGFLIGGRAVGQLFEAAGDELRAVK